MQVKTITGSTEEKEISIDKNVSSVLIVTDAVLNNELIKIEAITPSGNINIISSALVGDVSEITRALEMTTAKVGTEYFHLIRLTNNKLPLDLKGGKIAIELTKLNSGKSYKVYGIEVASAPLGVARLYEQDNVVSGQSNKSLDLTSYDALYIDDITNVETIEVTSLDGRTSKITTNEAIVLIAEFGAKGHIGDVDATDWSVDYKSLVLPLANISNIDLLTNGTAIGLLKVKHQIQY